MNRFIEQTVCPLKETGPGNLRNSEGAIIELKDGRLFLAYTHFYVDADDWGPADIRGKVSEDGGKTWSESFVVHPNTARYNSGRLSLVRLPEYRNIYANEFPLLGLIYVDFDLWYYNRIYFTTSFDEGQTWMQGVQINQTGMLGNVLHINDKALILKSGRILVPVCAQFGGLCASFMYYSDDGGTTWSRSRSDIGVNLIESGQTYGYSDFEEPTVVELRDGRLLCFGRTRLGQLYQSFSENSGVTWGKTQPTGLASSYSPASLKTIPGTGDIVCVWNQASGQEIADGLGRMRLSCAVSTDDGKSWRHFQNVASLDDITKIEPEGGTTDAVSELHAIRSRQALKRKGTQTQYPKEVTRRYPRWPGYVHNDYPSVTFTRTGNVLISYGASDYEIAGLPVGLKVVIRPIEWLYGKDNFS